MLQKFEGSFTKIKEINWVVVAVIICIACIGILMQFSASGSIFPWAIKQLPRLVVGVIMMCLVALVPLKIWMLNSYFFYIVTLVLLVVVELMGYVGMGAQRWINLGVFNLQPSELVKYSVILALSRYFHDASYKQMGSLKFIFPPLIIIALPVILVMRQPDLGTALLILSTGLIIIFLAGLRWYKIIAGLSIVIASMPLLWNKMHDYQKLRVLTFLDPERDPLGSGYHILQSKIALGSGGLFGKGFMAGTQSYLNFLPEKQTDFIFTMLCEEMGMVGGLVLIILYTIIIFYGYGVMAKNRSCYGRLVSMGITNILFLYMFINIGMVTGLLPVVGVPLPLVSYGGTQLITLLSGLGLLIGCDVHANSRI